MPYTLFKLHNMNKEQFLKFIRGYADSAPLVAALLAPVSTILEIPALTQRWYTQFGLPVPDPKGSLALSGVGLALNVIANVLLIVRFSSTNKKWWAPATSISTAAWLIKTIVAIINLAVFGIYSRNGPGFSYDEAFWCETAACVLSGIITIMLLSHYILVYGRKDRNGLKIRLTGKHFMLSISALMVIIAIQALIFSKIEGWSYFQGIYYSTVTMLTIGFGDFAPTHTATKILLLPFAILTISQLANEVSIIINFMSQRTQVRRDQWRSKYERAIKEQHHKRNPRATLMEEIEMLEKITHQEEMMAQVYDLFWSLTALVIFWMAGAAVFSSLEPDWTFGDALYFEVVYCLSIGYGDYSPTQPGSRVFFFLSALIAVPLIASFAVQAVTGLLSTFSNARAAREREQRAGIEKSTAFTQHREFILQRRQTLKDLLSRNKGDPEEDRPSEDTQVDDEPLVGKGLKETSDKVIEDNASHQSRRQRRTDERQLITEVMHYSIKLEALSRKLLVDALPSGLAKNILQADRNVQLRDVAAIGGDAQRLRDLWKEEREDEVKNDEDNRILEASGEPDLVILEEIRCYRETFAALLVAGAKLQCLEGEEVYKFERWLGERSDEGDDDAGQPNGDMFENSSEDVERAGHREKVMNKGLSAQEKMEEQKRLWKVLKREPTVDPDEDNFTPEDERDSSSSRSSHDGGDRRTNQVAQE